MMTAKTLTYLKEATMLITRLSPTVASHHPSLKTISLLTLLGDGLVARSAPADTTMSSFVWTMVHTLANTIEVRSFLKHRYNLLCLSTSLNSSQQLRLEHSTLHVSINKTRVSFRDTTTKTK